MRNEPTPTAIVRLISMSASAPDCRIVWRWDHTMLTTRPKRNAVGIPVSRDRSTESATTISAAGIGVKAFRMPKRRRPKASTTAEIAMLSTASEIARAITSRADLPVKPNSGSAKPRMTAPTPTSSRLDVHGLGNSSVEPRDEVLHPPADRVEPREGAAVVLPHGALQQLDGQGDERAGTGRRAVRRRAASLASMSSSYAGVRDLPKIVGSTSEVPLVVLSAATAVDIGGVCGDRVGPRRRVGRTRPEDGSAHGGRRRSVGRSDGHDELVRARREALGHRHQHPELAVVRDDRRAERDRVGMQLGRDGAPGRQPGAPQHHHVAEGQFVVVEVQPAHDRRRGGPRRARPVPTTEGARTTRGAAG